MAFNAIDYLKDGKVDFIYRLTPYDCEHIVKNIRKAPNKVEIINGFLSKLIEDYPSFCFDVIYDIPEFTSEAYEILNIKDVTIEKLKSMLHNSSIGLKILYENFDELLSKDDYAKEIIKYAFESNNEDLLHKLSRNQNLHVRFLFMNFLVKNYQSKIDTIYDDITKYVTSETFEPLEQISFLPKLMKSEDISKLAVSLLVNNHIEDYNKLKEFILKNYKYNHLASELLKLEFDIDPITHKLLEDTNKEKKEDAFSRDADMLFKTSADYRYPIYLKHKSKISSELLDDFSYRIRYFMDKNDKEENRELGTIYYCGLGNLLEEWTEKYMDISNSKEYGFVGGGSTCDCYRIGDYVIKLVNAKWSYEDEICPNLYLIIKNFEEKYVRREDGVIIGGLEVQKYLTRSAKDIDPKYFGYFDLALDRLGYKRTDTLVNGVCGENTMLLDTYLDADISNPEKVPGWFKKYPLVLIDRDRIYPKDKKYIKQLSSGY